MEYHFYLKEWLRDKWQLFRLWYLVDIFPKVGKWACHFEENNWFPVFVANGRKMTSSKNENFSATMSFTALSILKDVNDDIDGYIHKGNF